MAQIFISYSSKNRPFALKLKHSLESFGLEVWLDQEDIDAGLKWSTAIQQGLASSDLLVLVMSPEAMASTNVEDEWQWFLDKKKPIIPVYYKACEPPFQLSRYQYVDFREQVSNRCRPAPVFKVDLFC